MANCKKWWVETPGLSLTRDWTNNSSCLLKWRWLSWTTNYNRGHLHLQFEYLETSILFCSEGIPSVHLILVALHQARDRPNHDLPMPSTYTVPTMSATVAAWNPTRARMNIWLLLKFPCLKDTNPARSTPAVAIAPVNTPIHDLKIFSILGDLWST